MPHFPQIQRQRKRPRVKPAVLPSDSEEDSEGSDLQPDEEEDNDAAVQFAFQDYSFQQEGQLIAVYFMEDFYIGEVTQVLSPEEATVNFMEKATFQFGGRPVFRWPARTDKCKINAEVVFAKDIVLQPTSSSGQTFIVTAPEFLAEMYSALKASLAVQFICCFCTQVRIFW